MKSFITAIVGNITFGTILLLTAATAHAQVTSSSPAANTATVQYLGSQDDMLVFNVGYDNGQGNKFLVTIKDQDGAQLYQHSFSDKNFYRQFKLPKADRDK